MCFVPQHSTLFQHLNFQKFSEAIIFLTLLTSTCASRHNRVHFFGHFNLKVLRSWGVCTSWLRNVLRARTACNFSSLIWPDWSARRLSEPTLRPSGATNHWKNTVARDCSTFSRAYIFFLLTLSLLWSSLFFSYLLFSSLTLPTSALPSVHIVGSLTSKLPSTTLGAIS